MSQSFMPGFKDENELATVKICMILGIFFGFIPFLVVMFAYAQSLSPSSMDMIKAFVNFELCIFIGCFAIGLVPLINLLSPLLALVCFIWNLIVIVQSIQAINANQAVKVPVLVKLF